MRTHIYTLDHNYFSEINTPEKAYFLGLICADGNIELKTNKVAIGLTEKDKSILEFLSENCNCSKPLQYVDYTKYKKTSYNSSNMFRFVVTSKQWVEDLKNLGVVERKTFSLNLPKIDSNFQRDLIRGLVDGDGCLYVGFYKNKLQAEVTFTGTKEIIEEIKEIFQKELGIPTFIVTQRWPERNVNNYTVRICGIWRSILVMNWLYKDSEARLDRKYSKYTKLKDYVENEWFYSKRALSKLAITKEKAMEKLGWI